MSRFTNLSWWLGRTEEQKRRREEASDGLKSNKLGCAVLAGFVLVALVIIGAVAGDNDETGNQADEPSAPATPLERLEDAVAESGADSATVEMSGSTVSVTFEVSDNLTDGFIRTGIAQDVYDMAERIKKSGVDYEEVTFEGTFPLTDQFGNTEDGRVFYAAFTRSTLGQINYDNPTATSFENMENLAVDGIVQLHPDLR